jgi:hypothetical protein
MSQTTDSVYELMTHDHVLDANDACRAYAAYRLSQKDVGQWEQFVASAKDEIHSDPADPQWDHLVLIWADGSCYHGAEDDGLSHDCLYPSVSDLIDNLTGRSRVSDLSSDVTATIEALRRY